MSTKPPSGTRDFLPEEIRRREHVMRIVRDVYESYGFEPLETPAFENIETLLGKYGEEGNKLIFKILRRGEHEASGQADLALRYDLTVPLARVVAQYQNELPRFFKRYQIQPVWRADRPARGRFREFYQCDIDAIGSTSPVVEAELLAAVSEVLGRLRFENFEIRLNHRRALTALLDCAGVPPALHADALIALDKLDKVGAEGVEKEFLAKGVSDAASRACLTFFAGAAEGSTDSNASLDRLRHFVQGSEAGQTATDELAAILELANETRARGRIRIDPSLARGLSYYTGAIMEIAVPDLAGSLGGGGRYDNLVGMFLGRDVPACGFSLGLERIIVVMTERGMFPDDVTRGAIDVVVTFMDDQSRAEALRLAAELRETALRVDVFPEASRKFDKPLKYASARGARVMAIFGENERARGEVSIRDLQTRQQQAVARREGPAYIARTLNLEP
jgi:histidyl-tRNA synthetase